MIPNIKVDRGRSIIFYDQLGTGRSDITTDTTLWKLPNFVNNLDRIIDSLEIKEVHLLGHSWGCAIATEYYLTTKSAKVKSLILAGTFLSTELWINDANYLRSQLPDSIRTVLSFHEKRGSVDSKEYKAATEYFYRVYNLRTNPWPNYAECDSSISNREIYNYMWGPTEFYATGTLLNYSSVDRLDEIDIPVLLVVGEFDEARPETVAGLQKLFPNAQFDVIEDAAHAMFIDNPDDFNKVVKNFLRSVK
jgi:proline iminopeptidase